MDVTENDYPQVSTYQFKCNIARYIRALQEHRIKGVVIQNHKKPVALVVVLEDTPPPEKNKKEEALSSPMEHLLQMMEKGGF